MAPKSEITPGKNPLHCLELGAWAITWQIATDYWADENYAHVGRRYHLLWSTNRLDATTYVTQIIVGRLAVFLSNRSLPYQTLMQREAEE